MEKKQNIKDIVLDFDGTCTQIPRIYKGYLEQYLLELNKSITNEFPGEPLIADTEWQNAQEMVRSKSPNAGWMLGGTPSAPAAADPFIMADEATKLVLRLRNSKNTLPSPHSIAYATHPAPWRDDAADTFHQLVSKGIKIHFISNSSTTKIRERLKELFDANDSIMDHISVKGDAAKFRIEELKWEENSIPGSVQQKFLSLPSSSNAITTADLSRPVYLRRGSYFTAIYDEFKEKIQDLSSVVFCGDIWELDLVMPYALGANIHLIERMPPFDTCDYEIKAVPDAHRSRKSKDLRDLLAWVKSDF